jgi:hypothetical protein
MRDFDEKSDHASVGPPSPRVPAGLLPARTVVTAVWLSASLVQLVIWVLICTVGRRFVSPWWLWTVCFGGAVVAALWWFTKSWYGHVDDEGRRK